MKKTLSIIGAGDVGKTLGHLFVKHEVCTIQDVVTRRQATADQAVNFIGGGRALIDLAQLQPADVFMLTLNDDDLPDIIPVLAGHPALANAELVFQCSASLPAAHLLPLHSHVASCHPVMSFAQPEAVIDSFAGTHCVLEGSDQACDTLKTCFEALGAKVMWLRDRSFSAEQKSLYHAALVMACGGVAALLAIAKQGLQQAGISETEAMALMAPLTQRTVANVFSLGIPASLSGPAARGDVKTAAAHVAALQSWSPAFAQVYEHLNQTIVTLATRVPSEPK